MEINSYFTGKEDVKKIIIDYLGKAKTDIKVAVAWFTEPVLFDTLINILRKGINVELIITKHEFNKQCPNDFELINVLGGKFAEIGNDEQLMHMKFCVIDNHTVISGSANWTKKAFNQNNEEITIVSNAPERTKTYIEEFNRLKKIAGLYSSTINDISTVKILKYFNLFKAFINLGETDKINPYLFELQDIDSVTHILDLLNAHNYQQSIIEMDRFISLNSQIVDITTIEKLYLKTQINLISYQIEFLEIEKTETEAKIEQFIHRYIIELNPLLKKILQLKKKIYDKLKKHGITHNPFEDAEKEFRETQEQYEREIKNPIQELTKEDSKTIKEMHRESVKLCHPDSPQCIYENKEEAARVFNELTNAFKKNDIAKVKLIYNELKLGNHITNLDSESELELLRAKYESLKDKLFNLITQIKEIKLSQEYQTIEHLDNWDIYFEEQKAELEKEYEMLIKQFVNHE